MTDILSLETLYGIGSVLLTMVVLAPVVFAGPTGRICARWSFLGERIGIGAPWRLLEAAARPKPVVFEKTSFAVDLELAATRFDRTAIDAQSLKDGDRH